ncbi:MAG TPA: carboxylesterase/lipase family protein [Bryobacteraceae bacterium]|nr:carboxylesterase/lipase family protein [Bryobacteraceae bacterium]
MASTRMKRALVVLMANLGIHTCMAQAAAAVQVRTPAGLLEGALSADGKVVSFEGVPYAAPPVGPLRWKAPQPLAPWNGVRKATVFAPRCMQGPIYPDMVFRDPGPSEDCLYLNVWAPAGSAAAKLPVMVWIHGGGFAAGSTSEPRQDGAALAAKGVLVVSMNYRLGVFGFFNHPDLDKESGHKTAGNYGLLDQVAALQWVKTNIAAFGGDPNNVTIFGESAGSFSVSALMASPLSRGLFARAIGESGAFFGDLLRLQPHARAEKADGDFARSRLGVTDLAALRAKPAAEIMAAALQEDHLRFAPIVDGYFLPEDVSSIYFRGRQAHVPLLAGWNRDEGDYRTILLDEQPTQANYVARIRQIFGDKADSILSLYQGGSADEVKRSAQDLAGDQRIGYSTWKWLEAQLTTGKSTVYRYAFDQTLPLAPDAKGAEPSAPHAAEIDYVFETLAARKLPWRPEDRELSGIMSSYWTNFAKTGNPNGPGLPEWPAYQRKDDFQVIRLTADPAAEPDSHRERYLFLDANH